MQTLDFADVLNATRARCNWELFESREAWLDARCRSIGGSDVPILCGDRQFSGRLELWVAKGGAGIIPHDGTEPTAEMRWGLRQESVILEWWAEELDVAVWAPPKLHPAMARMKDRPRSHCTPDGIALIGNQLASVQIKATNAAWFSRHWKHGPPDYVLWQVYHEMDVLGLDVCRVIVAVDRRKPEDFIIRQCPDMVREIRYAIDQFWESVDAQEQPPIVDEPGTRAALRMMYDESPGELETILPAAALGWTNEVLAAKAAIKRETARQELAENKIIDALGYCTFGYLDESEMYWSHKTGRDGRRRLYLHNAKEIDCDG